MSALVHGLAGLILLVVAWANMGIAADKKATGHVKAASGWNFVGLAILALTAGIWSQI